MSAPTALLADRYRLERVLGRGGMGVVWEAWDERLHRRVAVKQLRAQPGLTAAETALANERAMREARINARLHHRYAVPVFDVVEHGGQPCLIMQFVPSVTLSAVLAEGGPLQPREAALLGAQVGSALAAAHQVGIVHRDVKPANILIAEDGAALISDFGIAHAMGDATLTQTGMVHGTPAYLAPEVARGGDSTYASDVFSLGATLYAALEGSPPFGKDPNSLVLLHRVASGQFNPPQRSGPLTPLLVSMLDPEPAARPSMAVVARQLSALSQAPESTGSAPIPPAVAAAAAAPAEPEVPTEALTPTVVRDTGAPVAPTVVAEPASPTSPPPPAATSATAAAPRRRGRLAALAALLIAAIVIVAVAAVWRANDRPATVADPASTPTTGQATSTEPTPTVSESASETPSPSPVASSSAPASPTASPRPSPSPTRTSGRPTDAELAAAVRNYYALLPDDTNRSWPLLTKSYQANPAGGRRSYNGFWGLVRKVSTSDVSGSAPDGAEAVVTYTYNDGRVVRERTSFRLVRDDGVLKIDGTTVLGSN